MRAWGCLGTISAANGSPARSWATLHRVGSPLPFSHTPNAPWRRWAWKALGQLASYLRQRGSVGTELGTNQVSRLFELSELSGFPPPSRRRALLHGHGRPSRHLGHWTATEFSASPQDQDSSLTLRSATSADAPAASPASGHDRCCLRGWFQEILCSRLTALDGPLIDSRAATATEAQSAY